MNMDLKAFRDFCAAKPADEEYVSTIPRNCAVAQFTGNHRIAHLGTAFGPELADAVHARPNTFGALTSRLEALLPLEPLLPFEHPPIEGSGFPDEVKS